MSPDGFSMQPKTPGLLWDILDSARLIVSWTGSRSLREYQQDDLLRSAVERRFEIIGEAARRLTRYDPATASRLPNLPQAIAFRNVLAHGYDDVDDARVWMIIAEFLPSLANEVEALLINEFGATTP